MIDAPEIIKVLELAAVDAAAAAELNADRAPSMRPSRAGLPLLQLFLEDFIIPLLPIDPNPWQPDPYATTMAIATGHLFEKAVGLRLPYDYRNFEVFSQVQLNTAVGVGNADFVVVNREKGYVEVIECKALKGTSVNEIRYEKCLTDNWGYLTQLSLYVDAVARVYPTYKVRGIWYVWLKQLNKHTKVKLMKPAPLAPVVRKAHLYDQCRKCFFESDELEQCVKLLLDNTDPLPEKTFIDGYYRASCGLHFSRYGDALVDKYGSLVDNAHDIVLEYLKIAKEQFTKNQEKI